MRQIIDGEVVEADLSGVEVYLGNEYTGGGGMRRTESMTLSIPLARAMRDMLCQLPLGDADVVLETDDGGVHVAIDAPEDAEETR